MDILIPLLTLSLAKYELEGYWVELTKTFLLEYPEPGFSTIILSKTFVEKHYPFANQTAKNLGKLIRTFDKAGLLSAARDFKM